MRVLRLFGAPEPAIRQAAEALPEQWQVTVQCATRGGETLAVLEAGGDAAQASEQLDRAQRSLQAACPDALYGEGTITLPEAAVKVLLARGKLLVCADAEAGALLEPRLEAVEGAEQVFDFGSQSYAHPQDREKLDEGSRRYAAQYPGDALQAEAGRVQAARRLVEADLAAGCVPREEDMVVLVGGKKGFWVRAVPRRENPALWLLDMLRRAACGLEQAEGTAWVRYGAPLPAGVEAPAAKAPEAEAAPAAPWVAERGEHALQEEAAPLPPTALPRKRRWPWVLLLLVLLLAAAACAAWYYTGGNWEALLKWLGLHEFSLSGASLL